MLKILIAVDGHEPSRRAIDAAARLAKEAGGLDVVLLNVRGGPEYYGDLQPLDYKAIERAQREAQARVLTQALEYARAAGLRNASTAEAEGLYADEIVRIAKERGVDQILMGTHGRGAVGSFFVGSVAQRVIHLASIPVTLVR